MQALPFYLQLENHHFHQTKWSEQGTLGVGSDLLIMHGCAVGAMWQRNRRVQCISAVPLPFMVPQIPP